MLGPEECNTDVILAECRLVSFETQLSKPICDSIAAPQSVRRGLGIT